MDLTEAEDIKKRWQEYTEEVHKKDLHDTDNHNGVITHLEPDILKCEVKWTLESITMNKASRGDGISVELFQILKDDAVKVLHKNLPSYLMHGQPFFLMEPSTPHLMYPFSDSAAYRQRSLSL